MRESAIIVLWRVCFQRAHLTQGCRVSIQVTSTPDKARKDMQQHPSCGSLCPQTRRRWWLRSAGADEWAPEHIGVLQAGDKRGLHECGEVRKTAVRRPDPGLALLHEVHQAEHRDLHQQEHAHY